MILVGISSGIIGTVFGLGGGVVIVPLLVGFFQQNIHQAIGMSLLCIFVRSLFSNRIFLQEKKINVPFALVLSFFSLLASYLGAKLSLVTFETVLIVLFALVVLFLNVLLFLPKKDIARQPRTPRTPSTPSAKENDLEREPRTPRTPSAKESVFSHQDGQIPYVPRKVGIGAGFSAFAAFLGGLLGIGGGSVLVPTMHYFCRVPLKIAIATSSFIISFSVFPALLVYLRAYQLNVPSVIQLIGGGILGSYIGSFILNKVSIKRLKVYYVVLNLIIVSLLLYSVLGTGA